VLDPELVEDPDDDAADVVPRAVRGPDRVQQQIQCPLVISSVERLEGLAQIGLLSLLELDLRCEPFGGEAAGDPLQQLERVVVLAAAVKDLCERDGGVGPSRLELDRSAQRVFIALLDQVVCLRGQQRIEETVDGGGRHGPYELGGDRSIAERLDGRNALDPVLPGDHWVGIDIHLGELDLAGSLFHGSLDYGAELPARPAPLRPEVHDHRNRVRALDNGGLESAIGDVHDTDGRKPRMADCAEVVEHAGVRLWVQDTGEGIPVVLLHGLTATHRYVVMGSKALERSDHRVIAYDARGHGHSSPAVDPSEYEYSQLVEDLSAVMDARGVGSAILAGASMGAHTLVSFALRAPERVAGLVVITPSFAGAAVDGPERMDRWHALAEGLRTGGVEGFVAAYGRPAVADAWQETVLKVIRQRLSQHEHPEAVADALDVVPASRPFASLQELARIAVPVAVVASDDEADPEHPQAVGEAYAAAIPGARLITDEPGRSPVAWQGSQLSKVIADVAARSRLT
jgi:pimeloyl-ACP methyl ester carboxylesterase